MLKQLTPRGWIILAAVSFALAGALSMFLVLSRGIEYTTPLIVIAILVWAAAGAIGWAILLRDALQVSVLRGAIAGLLIGLIVHPFVWYFTAVVTFLIGRPMPFVDEVVNPLEGLLLLPSATLVSWFSVGWITGLVSAIVGGILGYLHTGTFKETAPRSRITRILRGLGVALAIIGLILLPIGIVPISTTGLTSRPNPAASYDEALARLTQMEAEEDALPLLPECRTRLMTHGAQTEKVIVLYHGLTNCPRQFVELGEQFFDLGYNVLIARFPYHVNEGRSPSDLSALTAEKYRDLADASIDIARGLGRRVFVLGLSAGGTLASWVFQNRSDVERVVTVAPFFGIGAIPAWLNLFAVNLLPRVPPIAITAPVPLKHAIRGNNTRGLSETMRLGLAVAQQAESGPPAARSIVLVTNANDLSVDNDMARSLLPLWERQGAQTETFAFPKSLGLRHDLIDVQQRNQKPDIVYPVLMDLMEGRQPKLP